MINLEISYEFKKHCDLQLWKYVVFGKSLVTQPMLQSGPNRTELRSMDSFIQILGLFKKCK